MNYLVLNAMYTRPGAVISKKVLIISSTIANNLNFCNYLALLKFKWVKQLLVFDKTTVWLNQRKYRGQTTITTLQNKMMHQKNR